MSYMTIKLCDITTMDCDCIVNAANSSLLGGGGVNGAIHRTAGPELVKECATLDGCETGKAKITKGYRLVAPWIIHTVGPIYRGRKEDAKLLRNCYVNSLDLARKHFIHIIAFPAISTGTNGYPLREATDIAVGSVSDWFKKHRDYEMYVFFACFDTQTANIYRDRLVSL